MGFFSGLLMLQAVIVLWIFAFAFGFVLGAGVVCVSIEKTYPEVYQRLKDEVEKRKNR